jgi:hypothetical protein
MPRQVTIIQMRVTPATRQAWIAARKRHGARQIEMLSQLIEWLDAQDELVQHAILGCYPEGVAADIARCTEAVGPDEASLCRVLNICRTKCGDLRTWSALRYPTHGPITHRPPTCSAVRSIASEPR